MHERKGVGVAREIGDEQFHGNSRVTLSGLLAQEVPRAPDLPHGTLTDQTIELVVALQDHSFVRRERSVRPYRKHRDPGSRAHDDITIRRVDHDRGRIVACRRLLVERRERPGRFVDCVRPGLRAVAVGRVEKALRAIETDVMRIRDGIAGVNEAPCARCRIDFVDCNAFTARLALISRKAADIREPRAGTRRS